MSNVHTTKRGKQGCVSPDRRFPYPSNFARFIIIIAIQSLTHMDKIIIIILISGQTTKYCIVSVAETERASSSSTSLPRPFNYNLQHCKSRTHTRSKLYYVWWFAKRGSHFPVVPVSQYLIKVSSCMDGQENKRDVVDKETGNAIIIINIYNNCFRQ